MHNDEKEGEPSSNAEESFEYRAAAMLNHAFLPRLPLTNLNKPNAIDGWAGENRQF